MDLKTVILFLLLLPSVVFGQGVTGATSSVGHGAAPYLDGSGGGAHRWFVTTTGAGDNSGHSMANALVGIGGATAVVDAGDSVFIAAGTYNETMTLVTDGGSSTRIVFVNYQGGEVKVRGASIATTPYAYQTFKSEGHDYNTIQGLHFWWRGTNTNWSGPLFNSDYTVQISASDYLYFRYCTVTNGSGSGGDDTTKTNLEYWNEGNNTRGIVVSGTYNIIEYCNIQRFRENIVTTGVAPSYLIIRENWIHDMIYNGIIVTAGTPVRTMQNILIQNNLFENSCMEDGIQCQPSSTTAPVPRDNWGLIISNNIFRNLIENAIDMKGVRYGVVEYNVIYGISGDDNGTGGAIKFDDPYTGFWSNDSWGGNAIDGRDGGSDSTSNCIVRRNLMYNNHGGLWMGADWSVYNNSFIANNLNYHTDNEFNLRLWGTAFGTYRMWVNNLSMDQTKGEIQPQDVSSDFTIDYNNYYKTSGTPRFYYSSTGYVDGLSAWKVNRGATSNKGVEANSISLAPGLVNVPANPTGEYSTYNFTPNVSSSMKDVGGQITKISTGSTGVAITVENSYPFTDGMGVQTGDSLLVVRGSTWNLVRITAINYAYHIITLDHAITTLANDPVYYWPFAGSLPDIGAGEYGMTWKRGTTPEPPPPGTKPDPTSNVSPADGSIQEQPILFKWRTSARATSYLLCITQVDNWNPYSSYTISSPDTQKSISGLTADRVVLWNVQAINSYGGSAFSTVGYCTTATSPLPDSTLLLSWRKSINQSTLTKNSSVVMSDLTGRDMISFIANPNNKFIEWPSNLRWLNVSPAPQPAPGGEGAYLFIRDSGDVAGFDLTVSGGGISEQRVKDMIDSALSPVSAPAPVVTSPILAGQTTVAGTGVNTNTVQVYVNGIASGSVATVSGTAWSATVASNLAIGNLVSAKQKSTGTWSAFSNVVTVTGTQSAAPVLTGPIAEDTTAVGGTTSETASTTIEVWRNATSLGTTTIVGGGTWNKGGLSPLVGGATITAKATAQYKTQSVASNSVIVGAVASYTTVYDTVKVTEDDGNSLHADYGGTGEKNTDGTNNVGRFRYYAGFRFNLDIPRGAVIDTCSITFTTGGSVEEMQTTDSLNFFVYDTSDCPAFADAHTHELSAHAAVSSVVSAPKLAPQAVTTAYTFTGLEALLQVPVSKAGWVSGNYAGFYIFEHYDGSVNWGYTLGRGQYFNIVDVSAPAALVDCPRIRVVYH